jgi:Ca-activated chloride channel family protein
MEMGRKMDGAGGRLNFTVMFRLAAVVAAVCALAAPVAADGMLFPVKEMPQPFSVKYHRVTVTIDNQIAKTHVDQAFVNDTDRVLEGTYLFPVPEGARVRDFTMYEGDKPLKGELLTKDEAVRIYEDIVRRQRDPGLLEYVGRDTIRARVFPIPAKGEKRFTVDYAEVVSREGNLCRYLYPLSPERFSARPLEDVTVAIHLKSQVPIKNVYCPSHEVSIRQLNDHEAEVSYEASQVKPTTDLVLYYALSEDDIGLSLLTYKERDGQGYWMLLASPKTPREDEVVAKDVVFVLDRTGSMGGEKIQQAKAALRFCLGRLHRADRFDVVAFNESRSTVGDKLMPASAANVQKAGRFVGELAARGGTDIDSALSATLRLFDSADRPRYVVFLTDGLPTVGETNVENILKHVAARNEGRVRFFVFGVGYDVNVHFLDRLSEQNLGVSEYVRPQENIEAKVSGFYAKVASPVLTDVALEVGGGKVAEVFPRPPYPDMFAGSQAIFVGTYEGRGLATFALKGRRATAKGGARKQTFVVKARLPSHDERYDFVPVLWASRKIGYLLDEVRLHHNKELVDEIVALSKEFGIMTEFTAFLVTEPGMPVAAARERALVSLDAARSATTGSWSVGQAQNAQRLKGAAAPAAAGGGYGGIGGFAQSYGAAGPAGGAPHAPGRAGSNQAFIDAEGRVRAVAGVQNVGRQTFYQRGNAWVDQRVGPKTPTVRIQRFSEAHFQLARASAEARRYLAVGDNVTFVMNNQAIVVGDEGKTRLSSAELKAIIGSASG